MNVEQRQTDAEPQTKPPDLGSESACRLLSATTTIAIYYYYSACKLNLILITVPRRVESWVDLRGQCTDTPAHNSFLSRDHKHV